jgi:putative MATE family efflux protein
MQEYTLRLGDAPLGRLLIKLSLPGMASTITTSLYNIVNTIWVSRIGYEAIAALTVIFPYQILFYAIGGGTGIGIAALVSRRFGEKNPEATNHVAGQVFFLSAFWGLLFILVTVSFPDQIVRLLGATPDIIKYSKQYLVITSFGAPLVIFEVVIASLLRGSGDAVKPMIIMISSTLINVVLDPLLIFGVGPFPELGVTGAALGTVIAQGFGALLGLYYLLAGKTAYHVKLAHLRPDLSIIKDIYRVGAPTAVFQVAESIVFLVMNTVVSVFGSVALAAVGIIIRISDFAYMPIMGVSHGLLPVIGFCFGAGNYKRLWEAFRKATLGVSVLLLVITVLIEIFTPQIVGVFAKDPALLSTSITAMRISMISMTLIGFNVLVTTTFQGLSRGVTALVLSLIKQFVVFIPLLYLGRYLWDLTGIWISWPIADSISTLVSLAFIWREYRIHQKKILFPKYT